MTKPDTYTIPDLTGAKGIILPNTYRIGDTIAVMTLRALIDKHCGVKQWYLRYPNPYLPILERYNVAPEPCKQWTQIGLGTAVEGAIEFDDVNLWIWNDVFRRINHRINFEATGLRHYDVVFSPLLASDYSTERNMHPHFVEDACRMLARLSNVIVLIDDPNPHDWHWLKRTGVCLMQAPLEEAIEIIGNAKLFIGGDTGLSHIAGCFPNLRQIAMHDRRNTERHVEREYDHAKEHREAILGVCQSIGVAVDDCEYRSFPNKSDVVELLFDHGGMDGETIGRLRRAVDQLYFGG